MSSQWCHSACMSHTCLYISKSMSLCLCLCVPVSLCLCVPVSLCLCVSVSLCLCLSLALSHLTLSRCHSVSAPPCPCDAYTYKCTYEHVSALPQPRFGIAELLVPGEASFYSDSDDGWWREKENMAHCNALQRTATHCNALQCTATHCNALQRTATHCNTLQPTATHCNALRSTAALGGNGHLSSWSTAHTTTYCNALQHSNALQHTVTHQRTPQHLAEMAICRCRGDALQHTLQHTATHCDTPRSAVALSRNNLLPPPRYKPHKGRGGGGGGGLPWGHFGSVGD